MVSSAAAAGASAVLARAEDAKVLLANGLALRNSARVSARAWSSRAALVARSVLDHGCSGAEPLIWPDIRSEVRVCEKSGAHEAARAGVERDDGGDRDSLDYEKSGAHEAARAGVEGDYARNQERTRPPEQA